MNKSIKYNNIPIFLPELACRNKCIFCNQNKITGVLNIPKPADIPIIVEKYLATIPAENHVEIAFFGGSFTGIEIELQNAYLKEAFKFVENQRVKGIRISTRPDYISTEILDLLKNNGVKTIELGAQSTDDEILLKSNRGTTFYDIHKSAKLIKKYNFELGLQMMLGLPADNLEKAIKTANDFVDLKADNTRIYPALVIKNTELENLYLQGKYSPLSLDEAVFQAKEVFKIYHENSVNVIRVGLHQSEEFNSGESLVAGPYHQSFKELVLTELWADILKEIISEPNSEKFDIFVNSQQLSYAIGYKSKNKKWLENRGLKVNFYKDNNLKDFEINVCNSR